MLDYSTLLYTAVRCASLPALTLGFSYRFEGAQNMPRRGPVLVIANHQSFLDPVLVGVASPRQLRFLARKTLFRNRAVDWFLTHMGGVPVDQEGVAKDGLRKVIEQLADGQVVGLFPEGHRTYDGAMQPLMPGVHLIIKRSQAPIVPVGIAGAVAAMPRWRPWPHPAPLFLPPEKSTIAVSIGRPIDPAKLLELPRERVLEELSLELQRIWGRAERLRRK